MIQRARPTSAWQVEILASLAESGIKQLAPGAKARAFGDIFASKLGELEFRQFGNLQQTLLPWATDEALDVIGEIFGVARLERVDSEVAEADSNFVFYVRRGTFGDINNGRDIVIPANVRLSTESSNGPVYLTLPTVLPAAASVSSVSAQSLMPGTQGNSPAGVFTRHNFTNYADSSLGTLLVRNEFGITGGRDREDDDSYRYRIHLKLQSRSGINEAALRYELLQLPGIQDVVFVRQAGSFITYLFGIAPVVSPTLIALAQQKLDERSAYPLVGTVVTPDLVGISLNTSLTFVSGVGPAERGIIMSTAAAAAQTYIDNLKIGETLVLNEIADRIRNSDARISDVGEPNRQLPEVFIWRSRSDGTRYSRYLVANYTPRTGERIIVENSRPGAIGLSAAN